MRGWDPPWSCYVCELKIPNSGHTVSSPPDKAVLETALLGQSARVKKQAHGTSLCSAGLLPGALGVGRWPWLHPYPLPSSLPPSTWRDSPLTQHPRQVPSSWGLPEMGQNILDWPKNLFRFSHNVPWIFINEQPSMFILGLKPVVPSVFWMFTIYHRFLREL